MAVDVTLKTVSSGYSTGTINENFTAIDTALQDALSRSGTLPNSMSSDLDMNGNAILNASVSLNQQVVILENIGGTANAITADTPSGVSSDSLFFIILSDPPGTNTSNTVTIDIDGEGAESIKSASGGDVAIGDIVDGVGTMFFRSGAEWRQLVSSTSVGIDFQGEWDNATTYTESQLVSLGGAIYYLDAASSLNDNPTSGSPWIELVDFNDVANSTVFANDAALAAATIAGAGTSVPFVTIVDRYRAEYKYSATLPGHDEYVQSADGAYWELDEKILNPYIFKAAGGASFGSGDDTQAFQDMMAFSKYHDGLPMWIFPDTYRVVDEELVFDFRAEFAGFDRHTTKIIFAGTPTKVKRTRNVWMSEYDTGDYSQESDDPAIGCGILLLASKGELRDITLEAEYTVVADYTLPFDAATDSPECDWDNAIFVGAPDCMVDNVETSGPWGNFGGNGGIRLDPTVYDTLEHVKVSNSVFRGRYGVAITGPHGQPDSGINYLDMTSSDTRGGGGVSDTIFENCECYDTQIRLSIDGNANRLVKRYGGTGGCLFIDGQIGLNTAKRQQQVRFTNCRFANVDEYTVFVNYINRLEFVSCHFEYRSGSYIEDGVTEQTSSDNSGRYITANARQVLFDGGEFSGEEDNMVYRDGTTQIITISNVSTAVDDGLSKGRINTGTRALTRPSWTPTLTASSGAATLSVAEAYGYVTDGVMRFNIKFVLTATTLSGPLLVSLHSDYPKANVDGDDKQLVQLAVDNATAGACGCFGVINNGGTSVVLYHQDTSGWSNMQGSDLTSSSEIMISGEYAFA